MARALVLALAVAGCVEGFTTPFMGRASGFLGRFSGQQQQQQVQQQPAFARQQKNGVMSMSSTEAPPKAAAVAASDPVVLGRGSRVCQKTVGGWRHHAVLCC